jgi:hypothetical protein
MIDMVMERDTHHKRTNKDHTISYLVTRLLAETH